MHIEQCILCIIHAENADVKSGAHQAGVRLREGGETGGCGMNAAEKNAVRQTLCRTA